MKRLILTLVFLFLLSTCAGATETIKVSTAWEFLEALGSDRVIEMAPGIYNLSKCDPFLVDFEVPPKLAEGVFWEEGIDGGILTLKGIKNLTIIGLGEDPKTEIVIEPRYSQVLVFINCSDVELKNFNAGHTAGNSNCDDGVLAFWESARINIHTVGMYGCGTNGLKLISASEVQVQDSVIYECTENAAIIVTSKNISFVNCVFRDNGSGVMPIIFVHGSESENISFGYCSFINNYGGGMFKVMDTAVSVWVSSFDGNYKESAIRYEENVELVNCRFNMAEVGSYQYVYNERDRWIWTLDDKPLPEMDMLYGADDTQSIRWLAVSPKLMEEAKGSPSGIVIYEMQYGNYYFLPYNRAHQVRKINYSYKDKHINVIWEDENGKYYEKGFSFPGLVDQGSDDAPTELDGVG